MKKTTTNKEPESSEIITLVQLPIIVQQLSEIKARFEADSEYALSLDVSEATYKDVKKVRADLTALFNDVETARKTVKKKILEPYEDFEAIYKSCITDIYKPTKEALDKRISEVEDALIAEKYEKAKNYFDEYAEFMIISGLDFAASGIVVNMSTSDKKLKDQAKAYVDERLGERAALQGMANAAELIAEWRSNGFKMAEAINTVTARLAAVDEAKAALNEEQIEEALAAEAEAQIDDAVRDYYGQSLEAPTIEAPAEEASEQLYDVDFGIRGATMEQVKSLITFMNERNITYVELN